VPVAQNGSVVPSAIEGCVGVTSMATSTAAVTVSVVAAPTLVPGSSAEMLVDPTATLVERPREPGALLTLAQPGFDELHVTASLRSCVVPSLNVPVAVKAVLVPSAIDGFVGVTDSDTSTAEVTVSAVEPLMPVPGSVAAIVVEPGAALLARPCVPGTLLAVAVALLDELQVTALVKSWVVPSLNVPVAVNAALVPSAIEGFVGVSDSDTSTAEVTVSGVEPLTPVPGSTAAIVVEPGAALVATP
jgi:hypothetical protein